MNQLSFQIKVNDELTLKENLQDYTHRIVGNLIVQERRIVKETCCKDPNYILLYSDMLTFRGKTVVVTMVDKKHRQDHNANYLGSFYYLTVMDRSGNSFECPIEFVSKSYALRRDHKRYKLHNKRLIC